MRSKWIGSELTKELRCEWHAVEEWGVKGGTGRATAERGGRGAEGGIEPFHSATELRAASLTDIGDNPLVCDGVARAVFRVPEGIGLKRMGCTCSDQYTESG